MNLHVQITNKVWIWNSQDFFCLGRFFLSTRIENQISSCILYKHINIQRRVFFFFHFCALFCFWDNVTYINICSIQDSLKTPLISTNDFILFYFFDRKIHLYFQILTLLGLPPDFSSSSSSFAWFFFFLKFFLISQNILGIWICFSDITRYIIKLETQNQFSLFFFTSYICHILALGYSQA